MKLGRGIRLAAAAGVAAGTFMFTTAAWADYGSSTPGNTSGGGGCTNCGQSPISGGGGGCTDCGVAGSTQSAPENQSSGPVVATPLVTPSPAVLGNQQAPAVLGQTLVKTPPAAPVHSGLPFTGADVAQLSGLGIVLVGAGVGARRLGRRRAASK